MPYYEYHSCSTFPIILQLVKKLSFVPNYLFVPNDPRSRYLFASFLVMDD